MDELIQIQKYRLIIEEEKKLNPLMYWEGNISIMNDSLEKTF